MVAICIKLYKLYQSWAVLDVSQKQILKNKISNTLGNGKDESRWEKEGKMESEIHKFDISSQKFRIRIL